MATKQTNKPKNKENVRKPITQRIIETILGLPRLLRILLAAFFALAIVLALSPIIDEIYIRFLYTEETRILPSLVSAGFGFVMYIIGWVMLVGYAGEDLAYRQTLKWYFGIGILAIIVVGIWFLRLMIYGSASFS